MAMRMPKRLGMRAWLLLLSLFAALPVAVFSVVVVALLGRAQQAGLVSEVTQRAEAAANAMEQRLGAAAASLGALAVSQPALTDNHSAIYAYAQRLLPLYPEALAIALVDPAGGQVINTLRPLGSLLPPTGDPDSARRVFETGRPALSGVYDGALAGRPVAVMGVPILVNGAVLHCLRMEIRTDAYNEILNQQRFPAEWTATVVDASGIVVARSRSPEASIGTKASATLLEALRSGRQEPFTWVTREGAVLRTAIVKVPGWDWFVAVGVPESTLTAPLRRSLLVMALGGGLLLLSGVAAALLLSRRLARKIELAYQASAALANGSDPVLPPTHIREIDDLGSALGAAKEREQQAVLDQLTRLPARARFLELAGALGAMCPAQGMRLATLLVDLDGFKQVNDRFGHARGDEVLVKTADILRRVVRDTDVVGRQGGDEFAVCVAAPSSMIETLASSVAGRIVRRIGGIGDGIGCSIGVYVCDEARPDIALGLQRADEAMYEAKRRGKNRHVMYGELAGPEPAKSRGSAPAPRQRG